MDYLDNLLQVSRQWLADPLVRKVVVAAIGAFAIGAAIRLLQRRVVARFIHDSATRYHARKVLTFAGFALAALFVASVFSDRIGSLGVPLGIAGAGIAFALQEVIMSVAGWVAIISGDFYKTGDRVQLGTIKGDVIDIGIFRTVVMECGDWVSGDLYNGRIVRLANSVVFKDAVYNYTDDFPFLWDEIVIPIRFGSDPALVRRLLAEVLSRAVGEYTASARDSWKAIVRKYRIDDAPVEPTITMTFDENWMTFTLRYIVDYRTRRAVKDRVFQGVLEGVAASEGRVQIASSSMDINVTDLPSTTPGAPPSPAGS
ncbi:MAG: mechanosensitive ion channel domain-containing protein [Gemmatimonadota bacterium]